VYETLTHYNPETDEADPMLATEWFNEGRDGGSGPYMIAQVPLSA